MTWSHRECVAEVYQSCPACGGSLPLESLPPAQGRVAMNWGALYLSAAGGLLLLIGASFTGGLLSTLSGYSRGVGVIAGAAAGMVLGSFFLVTSADWFDRYRARQASADARSGA